LSIRISRGKDQRPSRWNRIGESALDRAIQFNRNGTSIGVEEIDTARRCGASLVDQPDLGCPAAAIGELWEDSVAVAVLRRTEGASARQKLAGLDDLKDNPFPLNLSQWC
jgi:hypothetical protein